ncbi:MAG TPA: aspartate kinase [Parachlamydiaceae bacterium]|nr:aspartate kinase [Parachlamydiaceae bacterium]
MPTLVMKFGGASVATPAHFAQIADIILARSKQFEKIAVVVSAMGDTTNHLIALANQVNENPPRREYDMLVTVGERISVALLAMALAKKGAEAVSFTGSQSGIMTCNRHSEARIVDVRPHRILKGFEANKIVIVAGFQGVSQNGEITTLGRGGSDTTAVAIASALKASHVEFFKDVPGVFTEDPKTNPEAVLQEELSYKAALNIMLKGAKILHQRCVFLAEKNKIPLHIYSFKDNGQKMGTIIKEASVAYPEKPAYEDHE